MSLPNALAKREETKRTWLVILGIVFLIVGGYVVGTRHAHVTVHTGTCLSMAEQISCEADGAMFGIPTDVWWEDASGNANEGGRPECLPPTGIGEEGPIRFGTVDVESEFGRRWSQVVWVTCLN